METAVAGAAYDGKRNVQALHLRHIRLKQLQATVWILADGVRYKRQIGIANQIIIHRETRQILFHPIRTDTVLVQKPNLGDNQIGIKYISGLNVVFVRLLQNRYLLPCNGTDIVKRIGLRQLLHVRARVFLYINSTAMSRQAFSQNGFAGTLRSYDSYTEQNGNELTGEHQFDIDTNIVRLDGIR